MKMTTTAQTKEQFVNAWRAQKNSLSSLIWSIDANDADTVNKLMRAQEAIDEVIMIAADKCFPIGDV